MSEDKNYCVYIHIFPNNKVYLGITQNIKQRWGKNGYGYRKNIYFKRAIQKYGWENIEHKILFENLTKEEAEQKEIELISKYKSNQRKFGYNISKGGEYTTAGYKFTTKQKEKLSRAKTKPVYCIEDDRIYYSRKELLNQGYGTGYYKTCVGERETYRGKHFIFLDELALYKNGEKELKKGLRKKVICLESGKIYESISLASKDTGIPANSISSCCGGTTSSCHKLHFAYYNGETDYSNTKKIIEKMEKNKHLTKNSKKVKCVETNKIYDCITYAVKETGISHISECCYGKRKTAGGFHWQFVNGNIL